MRVKKLISIILGTALLLSGFADCIAGTAWTNVAKNAQNSRKEDGSVLYSENFEGYNVNENGGWTSPAGFVRITEEAGNKYLALTSLKNSTARSAYKEIEKVSENFVFEADIKTLLCNNVSAFEVLESKASLYMNHGCYSNGEYVFKMNRPKGLNKYVINNPVSDSGLALENYSQPASLTNEIPDEWLHVKVIGDFGNRTVTAYITSKNKKETYYHGRCNMSDNVKSFSCLSLLAPTTGIDTCIDNIEIRRASSEELEEIFYTVRINNGTDEFSQYVYEGEAVNNIPDMSVYKEHFSGWRVNGQMCSADELKKLAINQDTEIEAVISPDYIEEMKTVEFNLFPGDGELIVGEDNYISVKITGELGTSLVTDFDQRVKDYNIDWKFEGLEDEEVSVAYVSELKSKINCTINKVKKSSHGQVTVTVTYNGKTLSVSEKLHVSPTTKYVKETQEPGQGERCPYNKFSFGKSRVQNCTRAKKTGKGYLVTGAYIENADYISGKDFGFKAAVDAGEVYLVKATYEGMIRCEYVNGALSGFERKQDSLGEDVFYVAITGDGVLDVTFVGEGKLSKIEFEKLERKASQKPALWTIGDSTVQQNGSWGYTLNKTLASYGELNEAISAFHNSGRAGRNHKSYYTEGLFNNVLVGIKPGDIVFISGMGTNDSQSDKTAFKEYNNIYIDAIEAMGAYVILGSYTPVKGGYDADYLMFYGKRTNAYDRAIREIYKERTLAGDKKIIGFIDVGKIGDIMMTNDVRKVYNGAVAQGKTKREARLAANEKANEMIKWWKDYNHYYGDFSNYILPEITKRTAQLVKREEQTELPSVIELAREAIPASPAENKNFSIEVVSNSEFVDVSSLKMYGSTTYRMYAEDGSYKSVHSENAVVHNTTGGEVIIVPEYKFEFTNREKAFEGYVKVGENSYTKEKGYGLIDRDYKINENGCRPEGDAPIKVDVPKGYYDITICRKGGVRADVYSEGVQIIQNTTSWGSQNRPSYSGVMYAPQVLIENGSADITFGNTSGNNERIAWVELVRVPEKFHRSIVWIAGDSESANYYPINAEGLDIDSEKIMMTGFGMQLGKFLSDKYRVANFGQPSATAQSWNDESLDAVGKRMQKGDTILICFGINDGNKNVGIDNAKANIKRIVDTAKEKWATAILMSPVYSNKYQGKSYFTYSNGINELEAYAKELGVKFIDLNRFTMKYINDAVEETEDYSWAANNYHVGDNLHLTQHSATLVASIIAAQMADMGYETTDYAHPYRDISATALDENSNIIRGKETSVVRCYSIAEAKKLIEATLAPPEKESDILTEYTSPKTKWTFNVAQPKTEGKNVPVVSGSATWSEANGNIQFNADTTETGRLTLSLEPKIENNVSVEFDLHVGALGGQVFEYTVTDGSSNKLIECSFDAYYHSGDIKVAGKSIATGSEFIGSIPSARGDGMNATVVRIKNTIDFTEGKVTVKIGNGEFTGLLTGFEDGSVSGIEFQSSRTKTAPRHIYLDNISIEEYEKGINVVTLYSDDENIYIAVSEALHGKLIVASCDGEGALREVQVIDESEAVFKKEDGNIKIFGWVSVNGEIHYVNRLVSMADIPQKIKSVKDENVPVPKEADLVIFMGQSNMAGRGEAENATVCPTGHGYEFRAVTAPDALYNVTGPFGKMENNGAVNDNNSKGADRRSGDMVSSVMESYYQKTGRPMVGVQCSRGGTDIRYWNSESVKNEAQARLIAAKNYLEAQGCSINKICVVWCQGESDGDRLYAGKQSVEAYKAGVVKVFEYMKEAGAEVMFIVQTGHFNGEDADGLHDDAYVAIHDAQGNIAMENDSIYVAGSFLEYKDAMKDSYHYNQNAYNEVGKAVGEAIAHVIGNTK